MRGGEIRNMRCNFTDHSIDIYIYLRIGLITIDLYGTFLIDPLISLTLFVGIDRPSDLYPFGRWFCIHDSSALGREVSRCRQAPIELVRVTV